MYIIDLIVLTNIPRPNPAIFTYYYPKKIVRFSLVEAPIGKKWYPALVLASKPIRDAKLFLRKSSRFTLKEVKRVVREEPIIYDWQFELASWMADYYWASLGAILKKFIPAYVLAYRAKSYELCRGGKKQQRLFLFPDMSFFEKVQLPKEYVRVTSLMGKKKEYLLFKNIACAAALDIVGTRRSLFAPFNGLKEIHIYEEADSNHTSWDQRPKYNAVKVASQLSRLHNAKIIYHSSLPSLEMFHAKTDFEPLKQNNPERIEIIDLTKEKLHKPFGQEVKKALTGCYMAGKQAVLYLNRRGESRFLLCRDCGFSPRCPDCELVLIFHIDVQPNQARKLLCHHCGYQEAPPTFCSQCGSHNIRSYGFGTERVQNELHDLFPKAKILRLDSDIVKSESQKKELMEKFSLGANFLVATSMIFSTPVYSVETLVVLSADSEANIPDFAQSEKLFFNLWRLKSWSKRLLLIQTYNPSSIVFQAFTSGNWKTFYVKERAIRKALNYPPFSSIIKLTYAHKDDQRARQEAEVMYKKLEQQAKSFQFSVFSFQFLGPAPAFLPKLKGRYRYNILIKLKTKNSKVKTNLLSIVPSFWQVEVDPVDSL